MERKLLCVDFDLWCELEKCLEKGENAGELHSTRGILIKGHPIRTRIFLSKSSLDHFLTMYATVIESVAETNPLIEHLFSIFLFSTYIQTIVF